MKKDIVFFVLFLMIFGFSNFVLAVESSTGGGGGGGGEGTNGDIIRNYIKQQGRKGDQLKLIDFL